MDLKKSYHCKYCEQEYKRESAFLKHQCKYKDRFEVEIKTVVGQLAYHLYEEWLISRYGVFKGDTSTFIYSKYYTSFIKFAKFVKYVKLNDVSEYISYMNSNSIPPTIWHNITVYSEYLKLYEKNTPITKQIQCSIKFLFKLSDEYQCDICDIFNYVYFNEIYELVVQRKVAIALLIKSKKFHKYVALLSNEQQQLFNEIIDFKYYKQLLQNKKINTLITACIDELNI